MHVWHMQALASDVEHLNFLKAFWRSPTLPCLHLDCIANCNPMTAHCGRTAETIADHNAAVCVTTPRLADEWHHELGPVLWWRFPIVEPPYVGTPHDMTKSAMRDVEQTGPHTPGPWGFGRTGSDKIMIIGPNDGPYVCHIQIVQAGGGAISAIMEPERRANARLIAAAPDMYDLLVRLEAHCGAFTNNFISELCRAVITKARPLLDDHRPEK